MSKEKKSIFTERQKVKLFNAAVNTAAVAADTLLAVALIPLSPFIMLRKVIDNTRYRYVDGKYVGQGTLAVLLAPVWAIAGIIEDAKNDDTAEKNIKYSISVKRVIQESKQRIKNYDAAGGKYNLGDLLNQEEAQRVRKALEKKIQDNLEDFSDLPQETLNHIVAESATITSARKMADVARKEQQKQQIQEISKRFPNLSAETVDLIVNASQYSLGGADKIYEYLRRPRKPYKSDEAEFEEAIDYGTMSHKGVRLTSNSYWFVHEPMHQYADAAYHISLNTRVTKDLLQSLDKIVEMDAGRVICQYKFPRRHLFERQVLNRHDPITVYTTHRDANIEQQIVKAAAPYVRSNEGLIGEMLGRGVDINEETSKYGVSVGESVAQMLYNYVWRRGKLR